MPQTGLDSFDKTIQVTNIWLNEIMEDIGPDRHNALHALRAVLHPLRDRLPLEEAVQLGAQLPMLVRGVYYENWHPNRQAGRVRDREEFYAEVEDGLRGHARPMDPAAVTQAVLRVLADHVTAGEIAHVRNCLPADLKRLLPDGH